jgi:hypothetical protein
MDGYLQLYISALKVVKKNDAVAVQDLDFIYLYHTEEYAKILGENLIGRSLEDIPNVRLSAYLDRIRAVSHFINNTGKSARYIFSYPQTDNLQQCYVVEESLIIHPDTNKKLARLIKAQHIDVSLITQIFQMGHSLDSDLTLMSKLSDKGVEAKLPGFSLTQREEEVLFLLMLGKRYKSIARILSKAYHREIKDTAVNNTVNKQLFEKFAVASVDELIEKTIQLNVINKIPKALLEVMDGVLNVRIF